MLWCWVGRDLEGDIPPPHPWVGRGYVKRWVFSEGHSASCSASSNSQYAVGFPMIGDSDGGPQQVLHVGPESLQTLALMVSLGEHMGLMLSDYCFLFLSVIPRYGCLPPGRWAVPCSEKSMQHLMLPWSKAPRSGKAGQGAVHGAGLAAVLPDVGPHL